MARILPGGGACVRSGAIRVRRSSGRRRRVRRRDAAHGAARATRCGVGEGRVRAAGPVRLLHRADRRGTARRVRDARATRRGAPGDDGRWHRPWDSRCARRRVRRVRRVAVRLLHARHRREGRAPDRARSHDACRYRPRARRTCAAAPDGNRSSMGGWGDSAEGCTIAGRRLRKPQQAPIARARRVVARRHRATRSEGRRCRFSRLRYRDGRRDRRQGCAGGEAAFVDLPSAHALHIDAMGRWSMSSVRRSRRSCARFNLAEQAVLVEGALRGGVVSNGCRSCLIAPAAARHRRAALLVRRCRGPCHDRAGPCGCFRVSTCAAGDPLDAASSRVFVAARCGAHGPRMDALGRSVRSTAFTGEVLDLTIRSFGIIRARDLPPVTVTVVDDPGLPLLARASDAVRRLRRQHGPRRRPRERGRRRAARSRSRCPLAAPGSLTTDLRCASGPLCLGRERLRIRRLGVKKHLW